jgi:pyrimidine operon attenuation protein/uracil phosphoribosyltransferase
MALVEKGQLMDAARIKRALRRLALEIIEREKGPDHLMLVGIRTRGVPLAERLAAKMEALEGLHVPVGALDITFYRDDLSLIAPNPVVNKTTLSMDISGREIVLVDDVLYTGRTIRAALDHLMDYGRPKRVQLAVLIDRGHRELPIQADYVGKLVPTEENEVIKVMLAETDGIDQVLLVEKK